MNANAVLDVVRTLFRVCQTSYTHRNFFWKEVG